jgi:hypothetical protein
MAAIVTEYGPADLQVMHDQAIAHARQYHKGPLSDIGWRIAVRNDGTSLHSFFELADGRQQTYSTML